MSRYVSPHPTIGDIISNRYGKVMLKIPNYRDINPKPCARQPDRCHGCHKLPDCSEIWGSIHLGSRNPRFFLVPDRRFHPKPQRKIQTFSQAMHQNPVSKSETSRNLGHGFETSVISYWIFHPTTGTSLISELPPRPSPSPPFFWYSPRLSTLPRMSEAARVFVDS